MRVLVAEDDNVSRRLLEVTLDRLSYEVVSTEDGAQAWQAMQAPNAPQLAVLDWMMPEMDGLEVCRRIRQMESGPYVYIIFLTAKGQKRDVITALEAGADDFLVKPFDPQELRSRLAVGRRILKLEAALADKVAELQDALTHVKQLQGLLPMCMHCRKVKDDSDTWHRLEHYIQHHSSALFTHSLCAECLAQHYPEHSKVKG